MLHALPRVVFAAGIAALGVQNLVYRDFLAGLQPVPDWVLARGGLAIATGLLLIGAAIGVLAGYRRAAWLLTGVLGVFILGVHLPQLIAGPLTPGASTVLLELIAFAAAAWLLAGAPVPELARVAFAFAFIGFGLLHVLYWQYVAAVIPTWIPERVAWAYATGVAHALAGLAIAVDVWGRLAGALLGAMLASWVVILHVPRVVANPARAEWSSLFVALAMAGAAWVVAQHARRRPVFR